MSWQGVGLVWPPDKHQLDFSLFVSAKRRSPGCWVAQRRRSKVTRHVISCAPLLTDRSLFRISLLFIDCKDLCLFFWCKIDWLVKTTFPKVSSITTTTRSWSCNWGGCKDSEFWGKGKFCVVAVWFLTSLQNQILCCFQFYTFSCFLKQLTFLGKDYDGLRS